MTTKTTTTKQVVRRNTQVAVKWQVDHWQPKTLVSVVVDQDPGAGYGTEPVKLAPGANTDKNGRGNFVTLMPKLGTFIFTITVKDPRGDRITKATVDVHELSYTAFTADKADVARGGHVKLTWAVDVAEGCTFELVTKTPDGKESRSAAAVDAKGQGSADVKLDVEGAHEFHLECKDPTLAPGTAGPKSAVVKVTARPAAYTLTAEARSHTGAKLLVDKDKNLPRVRTSEPFQVHWNVQSDGDLSAVASLSLVDPDGKKTALTVSAKENAAHGDQALTLVSKTPDADSEVTVALVAADAAGKELARKDLKILLTKKLLDKRQEMLDLIDHWMPTSLSNPRIGGQPVKDLKATPDLMAKANWTKAEGEASKKVKDENEERRKKREAWQQQVKDAKAAGKPPPEKPKDIDPIPLVTSCGDVLRALLVLWRSQFVGAFGIRDASGRVPPDKEGIKNNNPQLKKYKPGAKQLGYYVDATPGARPEPGDIYCLRAADGSLAHVGIVYAVWDDGWMTADGGAGALPDQEAVVGKRKVTYKNDIPHFLSVTDGKEKRLDGWVKLDLLPQDPKKSP